LAYNHQTADGSWSVRILDLEDAEEPWAFLDGQTDGPAAFSPDGRWLAYVSDDSGQPEVYVTSFPNPGRRWQVSEDGSVAVWWPRQSGEILYQALDGEILSVPVELSEETVGLGSATILFKAPLPREKIFAAVAPDPQGQRFLIHRPPQFTTDVVNLVLGWPALLEGTQDQ